MNKQVRESDFYSQHCREYCQRTFGADMSEVLILLAKHLRPGSHILDAGCGSGRDLLWFKKRGFEVTGFERSPQLAALAGQHAECEIIEGDFEHYDFSKLSYSAVMMMGSLVHVPHENFEQTLMNIVRAVKKTGYVLISLKEGAGRRTGHDSRVFYLWQDEKLRKIFSDNDFSIVEYSRQASELGTDEIWLAYVLRKKQLI
jgi:SAM-dependent methyltransferase